MSDYQPGAVPPSDDPLGDPAEAELPERIAEARALLDAIPVDRGRPRSRFLEKRRARGRGAAASSTSASYFYRSSGS